MLTLADIVSSLDRHYPTRLVAGATAPRASVALVLAGPEDALCMCFIRRSRRTGDPWSGQMALPGGRVSADDPDALSTAARETHEEVGLALGVAQHLGRLSEMPVAPDADPERGVLSPYVFYAAAGLPPFTLCQREVAAAYWVPVQHLWMTQNRVQYVHEDRRYAAIAYRDEHIWGLTLRVLTAFARVLNKPLPVE